MKKYILFAAVSFAFATSAQAGSTSGNLQDPDHSAAHLTWTGSTPDNQGEDYGPTIIAQVTVKGSVLATCSIYGVDSENPGLKDTMDLGTIGITAGDELTASQLFNMAGPASANVHTQGAGCNAKNSVTVTKSANGLVNASPGVYDSNQFQANIPYSADVSFTGRTIAQGTGAGTLQHVNAGLANASGTGNFGAWRSALDLNLTIPAVTGKGLVAGTYQDTVTVTLALN